MAYNEFITMVLIFEYISVTPSEEKRDNNWE